MRDQVLGRRTKGTRVSRRHVHALGAVLQHVDLAQIDGLSDDRRSCKCYRRFCLAAKENREQVDPESTERTSSVAPAAPSILGGSERPVFQKRLDCLGVSVTQTTWYELRQWFFAAAKRRGPARVLFIANAHTLNLTWNNPRFRQVLRRADVVLNDGIGLEIYALIAGETFAENFIGTDLIPRLFESADPDTPLRVFLYGAKPARAEAAARSIRDRFPNVRVVGTIDGYTRDGVIEAINAVSPDLLLVGMGNPLQEVWIDENRTKIDVGVAVGVGALIDVLSGEVARAPYLMRRLRAEWLFRLALEPKRMFRRYVFGNPAFLWRSMLYVRFGIGSERRTT
jgi:exopolysaccharide biosynthesis WecB/TagA/CpsF family protein